jgi:predicted cobalt transporter CbtA
VNITLSVLAALIIFSWLQNPFVERLIAVAGLGALALAAIFFVGALGTMGPPQPEQVMRPMPPGFAERMTVVIYIVLLLYSAAIWGLIAVVRKVQRRRQQRTPTALTPRQGYSLRP